MRKRTEATQEKKVAVFFGGCSSEAEISVITGMYAVNLLRGTRYRVLPVYLPPEGGMLLGSWRHVRQFAASPAGRAVRLVRGGIACGRGRTVIGVDAALNCCHGGMGEDGTLAALLAWNGIPSASPAADASALFMDKWLTKIAARGLEIPVLPAWCVREEEFVRGREEVLAAAQAQGYPLVVKPARLGSSIGLSVAKGEEELRRALALAFELDGCALIERYLEGKRDVNCAACRRAGKVVLSPCEEVFSGGELLSYEEKYERGRGSCIPARLPEETSERIAHFTRRLYKAFDMRGVVRADFLVAGEQVYFNELNTVPGSLAAHLFAPSLAGARAFFLDLIDEALRSPPQKKRVIRTGILSEGIFSGAKGCKRRENPV